MIGKATYSQIHSLIPREVILVKIVEKKIFKDYNSALEYCRKMRISGDYTYVPVEVLEMKKTKKNIRNAPKSGVKNLP